MTEHDNRAVTFDPAAFQVWLDQPEALGDPASGTFRDNNGYLSSAWQRGAGETGWMLESLLSSPLSREIPGAGQAWKHGEDVSSIQVWAVAEPEEGATGGVVAEIVVDRLALSLGYLHESDLVDSPHDTLPGYEAAALMLAALAARVNEAADWCRRVVELPAGELTAEQITLALQVLAKVWQFSRNGVTPKHVTVTGEQHAAADAVMELVAAAERRSDVIDAEIVEG